MNTRRIFCNSFFFFSWYFQHVYNIFSPEILIFVHDFSRDSAGFLTKWSNFTKFNQLPEIFHFSKLQNYKVRREVNVSRTFQKKFPRRKKFVGSLSLENCKNEIWQLPGGQSSGTLEPPGRFVTREGRVDPVLSSFSWKFTESPWPNLCSVSVSRWLCIVPGSPHGLTSRRREGTVCVASIRWLCWSAASSPMSVPTTAKCACFFVYSYPRILVHGLILPGRRFVSHIFIPSISLSSFRFFFILLLLPPPPFSSSPPEGRRDPVFIISECRGEACNFTEFYPSNFISCIRGPRNPGWNTVEIIAAMIFCLFVLMDRMESNRSRRIGQDSI